MSSPRKQLQGILTSVDVNIPSTNIDNKICDNLDKTNISDESNTKTNIILSTCANCGKEGSDITNTCNKCNAVNYCNAACKKKHRSKHKKKCERRVAELHDELLFKQPPQEEDCHICFLRMPSKVSGKKYMACCGKILCSGCIYSPVYDNQGNKVAEEKCPFCRSALDVCDSEFVKRYEKRMEVNDAWAFYDAGGFTADGVNGYQQNCTKALELWHRAGELGQASAYWNISTTYTRVGEKDMEKVVHYWELAAMLGHVKARHELGRMEAWVGNMDRSLRGWDRALKHFTIAAGLGCSNSLEEIKKLYTDGIARKEVYTKALRLYQTYLDEVKSAQRDEAAEYDEKFKYH